MKLMMNGQPITGNNDIAVDVDYDNSTSKLKASNVQSAIDEVNNMVSSISDNVDEINERVNSIIDKTPAKKEYKIIKDEKEYGIIRYNNYESEIIINTPMSYTSGETVDIGTIESEHCNPYDLRVPITSFSALPDLCGYAGYMTIKSTGELTLTFTLNGPSSISVYAHYYHK